MIFAVATFASEKEEPKALRAKALSGDAHSLYLMGLDCRPLTAKETEQNLEDAYAWLRAAAARGYYRAAAELEIVNAALERTGRTDKARARYQELAVLVAKRPKEEPTYRLISDPAIGYKFYASSQWGAPTIDGDILTIRLKSGGTAWITLQPCSAEMDKDMRERIKSSDPVLAMGMVELMKSQLGDVRLIKHGPSKDTIVRATYYVIAEIPANNDYRARASLMVLWPGVDKLVMLQFITFKESVRNESDEFSGIVETYNYTPPHLTKAMETFVNGLKVKE